MPHSIRVERLRTLFLDKLFPKLVILYNVASDHSQEGLVKKYRANAATDARTSYGIELCAGLRNCPETSSVVAPFEVLNNELDAAHVTRRNLRKPLLEKRAAFRFAHYNTDQTIRMLYRAAEIADGGRKNGPIAAFLFPDGLGPVVAPYGMRQIPPTEKLVSDMQRCKVPGSEAFCTEWLAKLQAALGQLKSTADAYKLANKAHADAFQDELALRTEHYHAVDKLMGLVRAAFPNDRARQDLIFPVMDDDTEAVEPDDGDSSENKG